ncbi:siderophore-interacting protein [Citricoccus muralis]|uniref:Siderophore-interacting protein n=1 Tax=Citricoccus muralis TaxID=169134 RepID=A0ABY8H5Y9_9MICC|nr:siderophore-interacting protein [Citricoccus muralis]WFP16135.1 siderophore-interacting protein [Citricoccus muralis]
MSNITVAHADSGLVTTQVSENSSFERMSQRFGMGGYLKYLTLPQGTRPVIRSYTVRAFRQAAPGLPAETDVDFLVHGDDGVAGPWAVAVQPGTEVAMIDQGCGIPKSHVTFCGYWKREKSAPS